MLLIITYTVHSFIPRHKCPILEFIPPIAVVPAEVTTTLEHQYSVPIPLTTESSEKGHYQLGR
jgi:hypothetical protein